MVPLAAAPSWLVGSKSKHSQVSLLRPRDQAHRERDAPHPPHRQGQGRRVLPSLPRLAVRCLPQPAHSRMASCHLPGGVPLDRLDRRVRRRCSVRSVSTSTCCNAVQHRRTACNALQRSATPRSAGTSAMAVWLVRRLRRPPAHQQCAVPSAGALPPLRTHHACRRARRHVVPCTVGRRCLGAAVLCSSSTL